MVSTILITDDNILESSVLRNFLYNERLNMITALNGKEALDVLEQRPVDLIILDLVMPVLDGYGFMKKFSETRLYSEIPVIVTSSLSHDKDIEAILCYNVFDYIQKPVDHLNKQILVNKIKAALRYRHMVLELNKANRLIDRMSSMTSRQGQESQTTPQG